MLKLCTSTTYAYMQSPYVYLQSLHVYLQSYFLVSERRPASEGE
jgi:hypothetical protein